MATAQALGKAGPRYGDLKRRLVFLVLALVVYRLGTHIPVPGINPDTLADLFRQNQGGILGMFNMFSGGALSRFSIFALGIMPYISASIIMQLMSVVMPTLEAIKANKPLREIHALWQQDLKEFNKRRANYLLY